jgi:broad specificity phosphatase PhoE
MPQVTIIRHGQTNRNTGMESDPEKIKNSNLNILGVFQASKLEGEYELVLLSPLRRALETYAKSNIRTGEVRILDLLHERRDGSTYNSLELIEPFVESYEDVRFRANEVIRYLKTLPHRTVCMVSHGTFMECFLQILGIDISEVDIHNCSQYKVFV